MVFAIRQIVLSKDVYILNEEVNISTNNYILERSFNSKHVVYLSNIFLFSL